MAEVTIEVVETNHFTLEIDLEDLAEEIENIDPQELREQLESGDLSERVRDWIGNDYATWNNDDEFEITCTDVED